MAKEKNIEQLKEDLQLISLLAQIQEEKNKLKRAEIDAEILASSKYAEIKKIEEDNKLNKLKKR